MNVIGHHTRGVELILPLMVRMEDRSQNAVAFGWSKRASFPGRERHHVFCPWALEVREVSAGVLGVSGTGYLSGR